MNLARYGLRCMKLILQHKPLAIAWSCCDYSKVVIAIEFSSVLSGTIIILTTKSRFYESKQLPWRAA